MLAIRISPADNVMVLTCRVEAGERIAIDGAEYLMTQTLGPGHKIAAQNIRRGEKILKYGVPIGSAVCDITAGEHVHLHNIKSDYLPTYTLEQGREFHGTT